MYLNKQIESPHSIDYLSAKAKIPRQPCAFNKLGKLVIFFQYYMLGNDGNQSFSKMMVSVTPLTDYIILPKKSLGPLASLYFKLSTPTKPRKIIRSHSNFQRTVPSSITLIFVKDMSIWDVQLFLLKNLTFDPNLQNVPKTVF